MCAERPGNPRRARCHGNLRCSPSAREIRGCASCCRRHPNRRHPVHSALTRTLAVLTPTEPVDLASLALGGAAGTAIAGGNARHRVARWGAILHCGGGSFGTDPLVN